MSAHARALRETLTLDSSYPYQVEGDLLSIWLPRGRGRDDRARGLVGRIFPCRDVRCLCSDTRVATVAIDDRAGSVEWEDGALHVIGRAHTELAIERLETISIDHFTGAVQGPDGAALTSQLAPFFREPLPGWVLDELYERWRGLRRPLDSWREQALREWQPGFLLSHLTVFPEARFDQFVRDGVVYQVDFTFCASPECACTHGRFCVLRIDYHSHDELSMEEVGSAEIDIKGLELTHYHGDRSVVIAVYLDWRARHPHHEDRVRRLRDETRRRGAELHALVAARAKAGHVGRNDPCRCGSEKKSKRCCGR